ncbi:MAG: glycerol-3-phosphate 1-O-acyltransferase PlsY [Anaplasma sp.]
MVLLSLVGSLSVAYLAGSVPIAYMLTRIFYKKDLRETGSGNSGATNVFRMNKKLGIVALILESSKSCVVLLFLEKYGLPRDVLYLAGLSSVIGHIFPIWLAFRGGRGVAVMIGITLAMDYKLCLVLLLTWASSCALFRYSSLSSIMSILVSCAYCMVSEELNSFLIYLATSLIVLVRHRANIMRLLRGEETKLFR